MPLQQQSAFKKVIGTRPKAVLEFQPVNLGNAKQLMDTKGDGFTVVQDIFSLISDFIKIQINLREIKKKEASSWDILYD